jgi:hypothetical protein
MSFVLLLAWAVCAVAGGYMGNARGRMTIGLLLGMFLGVIGLVIILCVPRTHENQVQREADRLRVLAEARRQALMQHWPPEYQPLDADEAAESLLERGEMP